MLEPLLTRRLSVKPKLWFNFRQAFFSVVSCRLSGFFDRSCVPRSSRSASTIVPSHRYLCSMTGSRALCAAHSGHEVTPVFMVGPTGFRSGGIGHVWGGTNLDCCIADSHNMGDRKSRCCRTRGMRDQPLHQSSLFGSCSVMPIAPLTKLGTWKGSSVKLRALTSVQIETQIKLVPETIKELSINMPNSSDLQKCQNRSSPSP